MNKLKQHSLRIRRVAKERRLRDKSPFSPPPPLEIFVKKFKIARVFYGSQKISFEKITPSPGKSPGYAAGKHSKFLAKNSVKKFDEKKRSWLFYCITSFCFVQSVFILRNALRLCYSVWHFQLSCVCAIHYLVFECSAALSSLFLIELLRWCSIFITHMWALLERDTISNAFIWTQKNYMTIADNIFSARNKTNV